MEKEKEEWSKMNSRNWFLGLSKEYLANILMAIKFQNVVEE